MIRVALFLLAGFAILLLYFRSGSIHHLRSHAATLAFQRTHPCPATGKTYGACPGFVKDHIVALCRGGPDVAANLQWQTVAEAKAKDRWECRKRASGQPDVDALKLGQRDLRLVLPKLVRDGLELDQRPVRVGRVVAFEIIDVD